MVDSQLDTRTSQQWCTSRPGDVSYYFLCWSYHSPYVVLSCLPGHALCQTGSIRLRQQTIQLSLLSTAIGVTGHGKVYKIPFYYWWLRYSRGYQEVSGLLLGFKLISYFLGDFTAFLYHTLNYCRMRGHGELKKEDKHQITCSYHLHCASEWSIFDVYVQQT